MKIVSGADVLAELHEQAFLADADVERVERLHAIELIGRHVALAQAATCPGRRTRWPAACRKSGTEAVARCSASVRGARPLPTTRWQLQSYGFLLRHQGPVLLAIPGNRLGQSGGQRYLRTPTGSAVGLFDVGAGDPFMRPFRQCAEAGRASEPERAVNWSTTSRIDTSEPEPISRISPSTPSAEAKAIRPSTVSST